MCVQCITSGLAMPHNLRKCSALRLRAVVNKFIQAHNNGQWRLDLTKIIYGTIITRALLCTVHESKSQRDVQIYGVSSPLSHCTGYRAPSSQEERLIAPVQSNRHCTGSPYVPV